MGRVTQTAAGLAALRKTLADLSGTAQRAAGHTLRQVAEVAADRVRAAYPADPLADIRVEDNPDQIGSLLVVDHPLAREVEFGTSRRPAQPVLRRIAETAAQEAPSLLAGAIRGALEGNPP